MKGFTLLFQQGGVLSALLLWFAIPLCAQQIVTAIHVQWDNNLTDSQPMQCVTSGEVANPCFYFLVAYKFPIINVTVDWAELQELTQAHSVQPIRQTSFSIQSGLHSGCTQPPVSDPQNWSLRYCGMFPTMGTQLHNSPYRVTVQYRYLAIVGYNPMPIYQTFGPYQTSMEFSVRNLVVSSADEVKVLKWDPDRPEVCDTSFQYTLDDAQARDVPVRISIYSTEGSKVFEVTEQKRCPLTYTFTWNGGNSLGQPAPPGLYVFDVEVNPNAGSSGDTDRLRSRALSITNVLLSGLPCDATDYIKIGVGYTLNNSVPPVSCVIQSWGYIIDLVSNSRYWRFLGGESAPTNLGANTREMLLLRDAIASIGGSLHYVIHALDNHPELYKDHCRRWALPVGRGMYHKILDVPYHHQGYDSDADGRVDEDPADGIDNDFDGLTDEDVPEPWCGQATAQMWIDYKNGNGFTPCQLAIAQWVFETFGAFGARSPMERGIYPCEYGAVLNHYLDVTKYHRYVSQSQDDIIGREAHLIAEYHEPSAAVCEMDLPGDPNNPTDGRWHWLLVVGCAASGWPGSGGVNVYGLWVHDPGGWFSPVPAYVSSGIWKRKYFEVYTDRDGASGYMHVEDPPSGDERIDHLLPVRCEPPTKPHGTPVSLQHVQQIAAEGVSLHLLNVVGHLAPYFHKAQPATPMKVRSLSPKFGDYYVVPFMQAGKVKALVIVDAVNGQFHGASACSISTDRFPLISETQVRQQVTSRTGKGIQRVELVWQFCEEAQSPYAPLWRVTLEDGSNLFISQKGKVYHRLTSHSCVGGKK